MSRLCPRGKAIGATPRMIQVRADVPVSSRLIRSDLLPVWWERWRLKRLVTAIMRMLIARRSRRGLGLSHLPVVAIGITEVKPLDARAWAIQVILHVADFDALCFELVVRRVNM